MSRDPEQGPIRPLLIDHSELVFQASARMLESLGPGIYECQWSRDYESGLKALMNESFDVCLLDYHLEGRTSVELLRTINALDLQVPVIVMTSSATVAKDEACLSYGAVDFLDKTTITATTLDRAIRYGIAQRRSEREQRAIRRELARQNADLVASLRRLEDIQQSHLRTLAELQALRQKHVVPLQTLVDDLRFASPDIIVQRFDSVAREVHTLAQELEPLVATTANLEQLQNKRILLAESDGKLQVLARTALQGSGSAVDLAKTEQEGRDLLERKHYDIVLVNHEFLPLATIAHEHDPSCRIVFVTAEHASEYVELLSSYPFLMNIVSRTAGSRSHTLKNMLTTVRKLASGDVFGLEKYLSWGVEVHEHLIPSSESRASLMHQLEEELRELRLRPSFIRSALLIAEELIINAVYDAPIDEGGTPLYHHLARTEIVELPAAQQARLRYACDGDFLAISVEDPFGSLNQHQILSRLSARYGAQAVSDTGGLFQVLEHSTTLAFNVTQGKRTEVISIISLDPELRSKGASRSGSLHFFCTTN